MSQAVSLQDLLAGISTADAIPEIHITGLELDNRFIQAGMAFVALQGTQQHGLHYAAAAVNAGAVVVLYEPEVNLTLPDLAVNLVAIPNLRQHLGKIARYFYQQADKDLFMVGITGTDGKTSVSHFVAEALNAQPEARTALIGTIGIGIPGQLRSSTHTTPDVLSMHRLLGELSAEGCDSVAMEVSSHALDQGRVDGLHYDVAVLTNLTRDHLDYHGTVEAYAEAKRKLFVWPGLKTAVLNLDDAFGQRLAAELSPSATQVLGYGIGQPEDYPAGSLVATDELFDHAGIHAQLHYADEQAALQATVLGRFNLHNLLAAAGVLLAKGFSLQETVQRLQRVNVVAGRMERVHSDAAAGRLVIVDYAHTPGALQQVLQAARVHTRKKLLCVFGCGGDRDKGKRSLMAQMAESGADVVVITDDNPRTEDPTQIVEDIMKGITNKKYVVCKHDRAQAIRLAVSQAEEGDTVVIAGKGHEQMQILADCTVPFDDREQAAQALQECAR